MANVITWSLERNQHVQISLCAQHSETHGGLSQVQHGLHTGVCEDCLAERSRRAVKPRDGKFYLAPESDPTDAYAAGYDGNVFDSREEAEAAIRGLADALETSPSYWSVQQY